MTVPRAWAVLGVERDGRLTYIDVEPSDLAVAVAQAQLFGRRAVLMAPDEAVAAFKNGQAPSATTGGNDG